MVVLALACALAISGDAVVRGKTEDSEIVITTTSRCAGAIHSLKWRGKEFINSVDHGRQLQSASNFQLTEKITDETYNPTEAGSRDDHIGPRSSSVVHKLYAKGNVLETTNQMAFWLAPGQLSDKNQAHNKTVLSNHFLTKKVVIGVRGRPQLIGYDVKFTLPKDESHYAAVFESLTGYMPPEFSSFWRYDSSTKTLQPLSDGPGEQGDPVVLSTPDGKFAMGIYSPESMKKGYGRWRFRDHHVVKWNCVFRVKNPIPGASYSYRHFVAVGTRDQVCEELTLLTNGL